MMVSNLLSFHNRRMMISNLLPFHSSVFKCFRSQERNKCYFLKDPTNELQIAPCKKRLEEEERGRKRGGVALIMDIELSLTVR